jgi:hypothetical protein
VTVVDVKPVEDNTEPDNTDSDGEKVLRSKIDVVGGRLDN